MIMRHLCEIDGLQYILTLPFCSSVVYLLNLYSVEILKTEKTGNSDQAFLFSNFVYGGL